MQNSTYSEAGLALTKRFEGLRLQAYQDSGGIWTVGYGHTGGDVQPGQSMSQLTAEAFLREDLRKASDCVNRLVTVVLEQHQFDALVDFCFNAGAGNLARSTLLKYVNARRFEEAAEQFALWTLVKGKPNRGLQRRRAAESSLFRSTCMSGSSSG